MNGRELLGQIVAVGLVDVGRWTDSSFSVMPPECRDNCNEPEFHIPKWVPRSDDGASPLCKSRSRWQGLPVRLTPK